MNGRNVAASVRARLLNRARETRQNFSLVLTRYAIERLLYRISISKHENQFLLKGALLFDLWFDIPHRTTRDEHFADLVKNTHLAEHCQSGSVRINRIVSIVISSVIGCKGDSTKPREI